MGFLEGWVMSVGFGGAVVALGDDPYWNEEVDHDAVDGADGCA